MATATKSRKLSENTIVTVINNTRGELYYINRSMKDWRWGHTGDEHEMTIAELREMKSSYRTFFEKQWIVFAEEDVDVIPYLKLEKYYQESITPQFIEDKLDGNENEFTSFINSANANVRSMILAIARDKYKKGEMKNAYIVRTIEDTLGADIDIDNPRK